MNTEKSGTTKRFFIAMLIAAIMAVLTGAPAMAEKLVDIQEGTYYIKAVNGNAKGKVLYWDEKASDQNTCMMFESSAGHMRIMKYGILQKTATLMTITESTCTKTTPETRIAPSASRLTI